MTVILAELNAADESPRVEAKRSRDIGKSVIETVVAFANEPGLGGGHILLGGGSGVDDKGDARYWPEGLADPDKIQKDLASQSATMLNVAIRPEMSVVKEQE
jgi:ATP-dependent DNA helicase RecG